MHDFNDPRIVLGMALGLLMSQFDIDPEEAASALDRIALRDGRPPLHIARRIVQQRGHGDVRPTRPAVAPAPATTWVSPGPVPDGSNLSEREVQVLVLVAKGATNDEIAAELMLGINTVKTYIRTAYRKIGVTRRAQAVIWGIENGLSATRD